MADIVGSLFGATPQQVQADITNPIFRRAEAFANMDPMQQAQFNIYSGGAMLGQGIGGLLGGEDPRLIQARQMGQVKQYAAQQGIDVNTPEGLAQLAQYAQSIGATEGAMYLGQQALQLRKQTTEVTKTEEDYKREKAFREAVAAMPPEQRTEENIMQLAAQYGTTSTVMSALSSLTGKREAIAARQEAAQAKIDEKKAAAEEKATKAKQAALGAIGPIIESLTNIENRVGYTTAGLGGWATNWIPGTSSKDLKRDIETIQANLGFQQLQAMREASPTGGALGNVSNQELNSLKASVAALDPDQSPEQLKKNISKVMLHYTNWKKTLEGDLGTNQQQPQQGAPAPTGRENDPLGIR